MAANDAPFFNPFDPEVRANPYPHYRRLLEAPPFRFSPMVPAVVVARYDDVQRVIADPGAFSNERHQSTPFRQLELTAAPARY